MFWYIVWLSGGFVPSFIYLFWIDRDFIYDLLLIGVGPSTIPTCDLFKSASSWISNLDMCLFLFTFATLYYLALSFQYTVAQKGVHSLLFVHLVVPQKGIKMHLFGIICRSVLKVLNLSRWKGNSQCTVYE